MYLPHHYGDLNHGHIHLEGYGNGSILIQKKIQRQKSQMDGLGRIV